MTTVWLPDEASAFFHTIVTVWVLAAPAAVSPLHLVSSNDRPDSAPATKGTLTAVTTVGVSSVYPSFAEHATLVK